MTIEGRNLEFLTVHLRRMVGSKIRGVAIAYAYDTPIALDVESQHGTGIGNRAALHILHLNAHNGHVAPVGSQRLAVGTQDKP